MFFYLFYDQIRRYGSALTQPSQSGTRAKLNAHPWHRGLKHYILYCLENDNLKTA